MQQANDNHGVPLLLCRAQNPSNASPKRAYVLSRGRRVQPRCARISHEKSPVAHHQGLFSPQLDPLGRVEGVGVSGMLCLKTLDLPAGIKITKQAPGDKNRPRRLKAVQT